MHSGAIETLYKGYRFRSRLEARWAVFFDTLGIQWRYETEGFRVNDSFYLPDFYLPESGDWVEVKGDPDGLRREAGRISEVMSLDGPMGDRELLVLGDIPSPSDGTILHPRFSRDAEGLWRGWFFFGPVGSHWSPCGIGPTVVLGLMGLGYGHDELDPEGTQKAWRVSHEVLPTKVHFAPVWDAYSAARRARFEHGERG